MGKTLKEQELLKQRKERHDYRRQKRQEHDQVDDEWFEDEMNELARTRRRNDNRPE